MRSFILCTFLATCFLTVISSCSNPQKKVSENYSFKSIKYYVRYMQTNKELQADAKFKTDTVLQVEGPVLFNAKNMQLKKIPGIALLYRSVTKVATVDTLYTFEHQNKDGSTHKEPILMPAFEKVRLEQNILSQEKGGTLLWEGAKLTKDDALVIIYTDAKGNTFKQNHIGGTANTSLAFNGKQLAQFALGKGTILVIRKRTTVQRKQQTTLIKTVETYSQPIPFELK
jgi:hypothetical protein